MSEELKEKALEMIWKQDQEQGEGWSDDSYAIADIMVKFYLELTCELNHENQMNIANKIMEEDKEVLKELTNE